MLHAGIPSTREGESCPSPPAQGSEDEPSTPLLAVLRTEALQISHGHPTPSHPIPKSHPILPSIIPHPLCPSTFQCFLQSWGQALSSPQGQDTAASGEG